MSTEDAPDIPDSVIPDSVAASSGLPDDGIGLPSPTSAEDGLAALLGSDGGLDLGSLMEQAAGLQAQFAAAQEQAQASVVEGAAGGGAVRINVTGGFEFQSVHIDPAAVDPADVDMLQDLVLAALNDAVAQINELQQGSLGGIGLNDLFGS